MRRVALALAFIATVASGTVVVGGSVAHASPLAITPIIEAGGDHVCVVSSAGGVSCWGRNLFGQVGNGTFTNTASPVTISGLNGPVVAIATGGAHTCVVLASTGVECWGFNNAGQLGNGTFTNSSVPVVVTGLSGAVAVATGDVHSCALLSSGSVKCWGSNLYGQLGDGTKTNRSTPVPVNGITNAIAIGISGAVGHTCALLADHTVRCWGSNSNGQLGNGSRTNSSSPVAVSGITSAVAVTAGWQHSCALLADGTIRCWGLNRSGQLGDGTGTDATTPVAVRNLTGVRAIAGSVANTCALRTDASMWCWGSNSFGQLGNGTRAGSTVPVAVSGLSNVSDLGAGAAVTCALKTDGTAACWGYNWSGQLGRGSDANTSVPSTVNGLSGVRDVRAGGSHTCALLNAGTVDCWGHNDSGQLGNGTKTDARTAVAVIGLSGAALIAAGYAHVCAVLSAGTVKCWGANASGQLGNGSTTQSSTPVGVQNLSGVLRVAAGGAHTCALVNGGTVKCWGNNSSGQLGTGTRNRSLTPVSVSGLTGATAVATGAFHSCALVAGGAVKCWGYNGTGQLGNGTTNDSTLPVTVSGLTGATAIVAGDSHTCALLGTGSVKCWGADNYGQLGNGQMPAAPITTPIAVPGIANAVAITSGARHMCALLNDGTPRCWGDDYLGEVGYWPGVAIATPVTINGGLSGVTEFSANNQHTCARLSDGTAKCWGDNFYGQLGNGTTTFTGLAAPVIGIHADSAAPATSVLAPSDGATVSRNVVLDASASDNVGVTRVEFHATDASLHNTLLGSAALTIYGWVYTWDTTQVQPGTYAITSVARDAAGNTTTSSPISITVVDTTPPQVATVVPNNGATLSGTSTLDASATDNIGVTAVEFHAFDAAMHDTVIGSAARTIYGWIVMWDTTSVANGAYTLKSVAHDASGNSATSAPISVTIAN